MCRNEQSLSVRQLADSLYYAGLLVLDSGCRAVARECKNFPGVWDECRDNNVSLL